jgi:YidC/Oxa1 family membrane protein insertase
MHDLEVRVASTLLFSGVLLFVACLFYSVLYPQKVEAATGSAVPTTSAQSAYGYLAPIARPVEWTLRQIQTRVTYRTGRSSWGWAIVAATCLLNLLLLPFRVLAARNGKAMRALRPELQAIQTQYKGRDAEQSQAIAALYGKHKVHPLSSCLPGIAPFVVLAAFYSVLKNLTELHGAHWMWITDLSRPEELAVRALPVMMIATQVLLGRLTPNPAGDPKMDRIMAFMPLIFGFMFYGQPSALLLYWLTSNLLAVGQQYWLNKRYA